MTDRDPRLDSAYRASPRDEPPLELDERIRASARRAVAAGPQSLEAHAQGAAGRSWIARWRVPVSIAATVLVAVTLSYMVQEEEARRVPIDGAPSAAPTPAAVTPPAEAPKRADAESGQRIDESAARAQPQVAPITPPVAREKRAPAETQPPAPAPAPAPPARIEAPAAAGAVSNELEKRRTESAAPAMQTAPAAPAAPAPIAPAARPAPAPPTAPAMRAAPTGDAAEQLSRDRALADRPGRMERGAAAPTMGEAKARAPEAWIEEIRRLKAQGRDAEAAAELAEFRKRHPDYKVPADLLP
jgi:outer membrane biosynthesis protein TonB